MMFFIRNSLLTLIVLGVLTGGISIYVSSALYAETTTDRILQERRVLAEALSGQLATLSQAMPASAGRLSDILANTRQALPGIAFVRLIDVQSGAIVASADRSEVGIATPRLPRFAPGSAMISRNGEEGIIDVAHMSGGKNILWLGVASGFFTGTVIVHALQQGIIIVALFAMLAVGLYLIQWKFFIAPVRRLYDELAVVDREVKKPESGGAPPQAPTRDVSAIVESFNIVAERLRATLIHDRNVSKLKSDFITTTAHQLRTPLSGVNWALESLLSDKKNALSETQKQLVQRALEKTNELIGIVGMLLNAASIEKGKFGYRLEEASLVDDMKATVEEGQPTAEGADVTLVFDAGAAADMPHVRVDRERIRWVLRNLIENAIRYTRQGGTVTVTASHDDKEVTVGVADTGIGIAHGDRDNIFQKFFRATEAVEMRNEGSGLGLYIAKNIINHHGGKIWFESRHGKGTTFYFTIPIGNATDKALEEHITNLKDGI